jgi:hypothetical protein
MCTETADDLCLPIAGMCARLVLVNCKKTYGWRENKMKNVENEPAVLLRDGLVLLGPRGKGNHARQL